MAVIAKQRYKLDIAPKGGWVIVYASQHDNGAREIEFEITNQGNAFSIPALINVSVQGIKSNKSYFSHSCSYSGNIVTMALADDMTDVIGKAICVLKFTNSSQQKLATAKFVLNVDTDSSSEGVIIDTEAEEIFNQMLNDIRAQAASISADIAELQSMVGSPLVASTASAMTDHNKIYVYTGSESGYTNGNWYYWNGSAWTSGGVYNSTAFETDKTLSVENMAADAKAAGDEITGLKNDLDDSFNVIMYNADMPIRVVGEFILADLDSNGVPRPYKNYRCSSANIETAQSDITINAKAGYRYGWVSFDDLDDATWHGWYINEQVIAAGVRFRVQIAKVNEDQSVEADVVEFTNAIYVKTYIKKTSEKIASGESDILELKNAIVGTPAFSVVDGYYSDRGVLQEPSAYNQEKSTTVFSVNGYGSLSWVYVLNSSHANAMVSFCTWDKNGKFIERTTIFAENSKGGSGTIVIDNNVGFAAFSWRTIGLECMFTVNVHFDFSDMTATMNAIQYKIFGEPAKNVHYYGNMRPYGVCNINQITTIETDYSNPNGMDIYNDTLAMLFDGGNIVLWDLLNSLKIGEYTLASASGTNHANQAHFSSTMGENYPLLYVSECYGSHRCFVEDIGLESSRLIQTISFLNANQDYTGAFDWIVDNYRKKLLTYGITNNGLMIKTFNIPDTTMSEVVLTDADALDTWVLSDQINENFTPQGATVLYSTLYIAGFVSQVGNYIWALNTESHALKGRADISEIVSYSHECEDIAIYYEDVIMSTHSKRIYSLSFN